MNAPTDRSAITADVHQRCRLLGFALAGVARAEPAQYADELRGWLDRGEHGEMAYMARNIEVRADPRELLPGAQSIICVADRYAAQGCDRRTDEPRGRIARYARGDDYHIVIKKRLHALCDDLSEHYPGESFRTCVDTAPLLEREFAARAGLGAIGKNTMLIAPGSGSYLLLGEVVTTMDLQPLCSDLDTDPCATCTRCIDACPTDAITPWKVDANRCISYLTIEHRSPIDEQYHAAMGDWIFGCDICQEVCPHNQPTRRKKAKNEIHPAYEARRSDFDLLEVLNWDEQARREAFLRSSMKRAKLAMMKRNALIVAGNWVLKRRNDAGAEPHRTNGTDDPTSALLARMSEIAGSKDEDAIVRETAKQVLKRLEPTSP